MKRIIDQNSHCAIWKLVTNRGRLIGYQVVSQRTAGKTEEIPIFPQLWQAKEEFAAWTQTAHALDAKSV